MPKIFISAGEISGDYYASKLIDALKKVDPKLTFIGMGGDHMRRSGADVRIDVTGESTVGLLEPLFYLPKLLSAFFKAKALIKRERPDLVITLDYQGFHMALLSSIRKWGIPATYFIAPQEWQWGSEKGGRKVLSNVDQIYAIYEKEASFYASLGGRVSYVGHPMRDLAQGVISKSDLCKKLKVSSEAKILSVFGGSRPQEIKHVFPALLRAAELTRAQFPKSVLVVSVASKKFESEIKKSIEKWGVSNVKLYSGPSKNLIAASDLTFTKSGSITLEHAVLETPCLVAYRFSPLSYWIIKRVFKNKFKRIKYISLPNILTKSAILPEFIQEEATPEHISGLACEILKDQRKYRKIVSELGRVKSLLGDQGVMPRLANKIVRTLSENEVSTK
jgi:lipid-A-disaccharide synthase